MQATWDVTFSVEEHSVTALVGSNGAGKTAIMKAIAGILPHAGGRIVFQDQTIDKLPSHRRVALGVSLVPEGRRIFPYLTVKENLDIGAYSRVARAHFHETLSEVFRIFPVLASRKKQVAVSLSGGEQQMLAIGRGLMARPKLLMLDEPSLGLAPLLIKRLFEVIVKIRDEGVTILLVEQNIRQTLKHAKMAYVLETGRLTLQGPGGDLLKDPHIKKVYLGL
ncbi:MAG: ABC transporter ATP-binding protein [Desulfatiglandaceae bacterium]